LARVARASAQVEALREELQREQRISSTLLQQLHDVQRKLEEAATSNVPPRPRINRTETIVITPDSGPGDTREAEIEALRARIGALEAENQALRRRRDNRGVERPAPRAPGREMSPEEERAFEREMEAWGRGLEESMSRLGPRLQERMNALRPIIERRIEVIRPQIEERMRTLQPEMERTVRESTDAAIRALEDAQREMDRSQRLMERPR